MGNRWWAGAVVVEILTIFILLPLFMHWWRLGRIRSLSPFELALAFDAPLLRDVPPNAGAEGVIDQVGDVRVQLSADKKRLYVTSDHGRGTDEADT